MSIKLSKRVSKPLLADNSSIKILVIGTFVTFLNISSFTKESGPQGKEVKNKIPSTE